MGAVDRHIRTCFGLGVSLSHLYSAWAQIFRLDTLLHLHVPRQKFQSCTCRPARSANENYSHLKKVVDTLTRTWYSVIVGDSARVGAVSANENDSHLETRHKKRHHRKIGDAWKRLGWWESNPHLIPWRVGDVQ